MNVNHPSLQTENKPNVYAAIAHALQGTQVNTQYGIDSTEWEVWPVNASLLAKNVEGYQNLIKMYRFMFYCVLFPVVFIKRIYSLSGMCYV